MPNHDYVLANAAGAAFRADLNLALLAIVQQNSGTSEPTTTFPFMMWADTTNDLWKMRNGADNAWIEIGDLTAADLGHATKVAGAVPITQGGTGEITALAAWNAIKQLASSTVAGASLLYRNFIDGCVLAPDNTTSLPIGAGQVADSTNAVQFNIAALIKTTSAWAVGNSQGGLDTGTIANSTWYHVWAIRRSDTGVTDYLISLSAATPTMPTNYDAKRRIGSVLTNGSAQFIKYMQKGDEFIWDTALNDTSTITTSAVLRTLTIPPDISMRARISVQGTTFSSVMLLRHWSPLLSATHNEKGRTAAGYSYFTGSVTSGSIVDVWSNTSKQIYNQHSGTNNGYQLYTLGWKDLRGKDA